MTTAGYLSGFCPNVEILDTGIHRGDEYTLDDLRNIERNFRLALGVIDPPVVVGHEEDQPLVEGMVENTGVPAVGWVTAVRTARRKGADGVPRWVLMADLHGIHPEIAALVNSRQYRKVSPEIYAEDQHPEGAPKACRGPILRRLSLLGGELPQIKTLRDLPAVRFGETARVFRRAVLRRLDRVPTSDGKAWRVFSEVISMADEPSGSGGAPTIESVVDDLISGTPVTLTEELIATLSPDQKAMIASTLTPGGAGTEPPMDEPPAAPMAEWPEGVTRETAIADLVAAGEDETALSAMSDDEILAMWQEKVGGEPPPEVAPMSETARLRAAGVSKSAGQIAAAFSPAQFAEVRRMLAQVPAVKAQLASLTGDVARLTGDVARRKAAERAATVKAYCERWNREGYVTPSEVDPGSKTPNLYHRLMAADGSRVKKYGEKSLSDFDAAIAEIEGRGPGFALRQFRERVADPVKGGAGSDPHADRVKKYYEERRAKAGK